MLNYIWAGLIISSLVFAIGYDIRDLSGDTYRNGQAAPGGARLPRRLRPGRPPRAGGDPDRPADQYASFYRTEQAPAPSYAGYLLQTKEGTQLRFAAGAKLPEPLATIGKVSRSRDKELQGRLTGFTPPAGTARRRVRAGPLRQVQRHRRRGARLRQDGGGDRARPDRSAVALPRTAQDRRGGGHHLSAW